MNLNKKGLDDLIKVATAGERSEASAAEALRARLARIGKSPLAQDIDEFLAETPRYRHLDILRRLANLNQGAFEDLHRSDFISYLIATLPVDYDELMLAIRALRSYLLSRDLPLSSLAARDANSELEGSASEMHRLLRQRIS
jgi:hypothetical protein